MTTPSTQNFLSRSGMRHPDAQAQFYPAPAACTCFLHHEDEVQPCILFLLVAHGLADNAKCYVILLGRDPGTIRTPHIRSTHDYGTGSYNDHTGLLGIQLLRVTKPP